MKAEMSIKHYVAAKLAVDIRIKHVWQWKKSLGNVANTMSKGEWNHLSVTCGYWSLRQNFCKQNTLTLLASAALSFTSRPLTSLKSM